MSQAKPDPSALFSVALAIHQLSELGVLLTTKLLDREAPYPG